MKKSRNQTLVSPAATLSSATVRRGTSADDTMFIERIRETMDGLAAAFGATPPDLTRAKMLAIELQYLKNLERAAREWQPGKRVEVIH